MTTGFPFPVSFLPKKPVVVSGISSITAIDATGTVVLAPNKAFATRGDLLASRIPSSTTTVSVERYAAAGPVVNMTYSINDTTQVSVDPTSMAVTVLNTDGTTTTKYTKLISPRITPGMMGAVYDGTTDDAPFIQMAVTYFKSVYADDRNLNALLKTPIKMVAGSEIDMRGGGLWQPDTVSSFTNARGDIGTQYGDTGAIIQAHGSRTGTDVPLNDIVIRGVKMAPKVTQDGRNLLCISAYNVKNLTVESNDFSGFCTGLGLSLNSCTGRLVARYNAFHDWYSNVAWADKKSAQATGIGLDNDPVYSKYTTRMTIQFNRVEAFVKGSTAMGGGIGWQTDGVNVGATGQNTWHQITDNYFDGVDEAVDCFGNWNLIANNLIKNTTGAAVKITHGGCDNLVTGNDIWGAGLWVFAVAATVNGSVLRNKIIGNKCHQTGDGAVATTAHIYITDYDATKIADGNVSENNTYYHTGSVSIAVDCRTQWGKNKSVGDTFLTPPVDASGWCKLSSGATYTSFEFIRPVGGTQLQVNLNANFTKDGTATGEVIPYANITDDSRSEWDATNKKAVLKMPGRYNIKVNSKLASFGSGNRAFITIKGTASDLGGSFNVAIYEVDTATAISNASAYFERDFFLPQNSTIWTELSFASGSTAIIGSSTDSFLEIKHL